MPKRVLQTSHPRSPWVAGSLLVAIESVVASLNRVPDAIVSQRAFDDQGVVPDESTCSSMPGGD
ncbi:MAG: hypothetical protein ACK5OB_16980 [Pirellula sp.]|jgi:hypothetical protein